MKNETTGKSQRMTFLTTGILRHKIEEILNISSTRKPGLFGTFIFLILSKSKNNANLIGMF